jgi:hypothetical protein
MERVLPLHKARAGVMHSCGFISELSRNIAVKASVRTQNYKGEQPQYCLDTGRAYTCAVWALKILPILP